MEITKETARTTPVSQLLSNIDEWVDLLIENREEPTFDHTIGFWELTLVFPDFPWVPGVNVYARPWEHDDIWEDNEGDAHAYLLDRAKEKLKDQETKRLRQVATGPLAPIDWLTYADGEPGSGE